MDAGVHGGEPTNDASGTCNYRDEDEETPEQRLERQKNALLTMISVRELKALLAEMEGRSSAVTIKEERQPQKRNTPRGARRNPDKVGAGAGKVPGGANSGKRRGSKAQQQAGILRVTTFCFDRLEIGDFKLTAPDERCAVVPGTNWVKVDADQRVIIYQFILARSESQTPYNVTVHVPFSHIAAIFCGFPEIIIKLNQPAIQASCYQTFGTSYQIVNNMDVTEGQLTRSDVHKTALRRSTGTSFQEVLLAADLTFFSSILSNGNHLSASSSLYSNYVYNHPHGLLSDYGPSHQSSSYLGGMAPMAMGSSVAPHLTYSAPVMNMGAGGVQLADRQTQGQGQLMQLHPIQKESSTINDRDEAEFREMFASGEVMGGNGQSGGGSRNEVVEGLPPPQLSPIQSTYVTPLMNPHYGRRHMSSVDGLSDIASASVPRSVSSSLYALSGSPVFPPSNSPTSNSPTPSPYSMANLVPSNSTSDIPPSHSFPSTSLMTPSPLLPLSPYFSFSSLATPTTTASPAFWASTMGSLGMDEFDAIQTDFTEEKMEDATEGLHLTREMQQMEAFEDLDMIPKDEMKEDEDDLMMHGMGEEELLDHDDDEGAPFTCNDYSFSSLYNFDPLLSIDDCDQ